MRTYQPAYPVDWQNAWNDSDQTAAYAGVVRFGDDWNGLFLRGDDALYLAGILSDLLAGRALNNYQTFVLRNYLRTIELEVRQGA